MTIQNQDRVTNDAAPLLTQIVMDSESFQDCRSELETFVAEARTRLQSLSEALAQAQRAEISLDETDQTVTPSELESAVIHVESTCEPEQSPEQESAPPEEFATDSTACDAEDDDPMERLNAIKRRLADQVQNAS